MLLSAKRYFRYFDWISFSILIALCGIGLLFVFSATYRPEQPFSIFFKKQTFGVISGVVIYFLCSLTNHRSFMRWGYFMYLGVIALLIFTLIKGHIGMGAQRWLNVGLFKLQPSELAKVLFPAFISYYFYTENDSINYRFYDFIPVLAILGLSSLLILKQPDLGTALILVFSALIMLWIIGINKRFFTWGLLAVLITAPLSWQFLKPYQKQRIAVFFGEGDSKKERYQIEQSQIAIGSGGLLGKGFLKGTQNKLRFLPESRTDFIFSVIAEELGFLGVLVILLLYAFLFFRYLVAITTIKDPFSQLLAIGLLIHIVLSTIINIGMVIGLLPIVGIPLPIISYGLSNLWVTFASLGWFTSIVIRQSYIGK